MPRDVSRLCIDSIDSSFLFIADSSFLFIAESHVMVWMNYIQFVFNFSVEKFWGHFQFLPIMNEIALNILVQVCVQTRFSLLSDICLEVQLLACMVGACLGFLVFFFFSYFRNC